MFGLIYLVGSPLFWGIFIALAVLSSWIARICIKRKRRCNPCDNADNSPDNHCQDNRPDNCPAHDDRCRCNRPDNRNASTSVEAENARELLNAMGYAYDADENVFYTTRDAWQRRYGYCALYDAAAAPSGIVMDCEPVSFLHGGKRYLIELWKGQYGIACGCEVGVYVDTSHELLGSPWYYSISDEEMLDMSITLYRVRRSRRRRRSKNNWQSWSDPHRDAESKTRLFSRHERHWWLTGFIVGNFASPRDLEMTAEIILPNSGMRRAFLGALRRLGYSQHEAYEYGSAVVVHYTHPKSAQPITRGKLLERFTQLKNRLLCRQYRRLTRGNENMLDALATLDAQHSRLYSTAITPGRSTERFAKFAEHLPPVD